MICALTEFHALCGFRDPATTMRLISDLNLAALDEVMSELAAVLRGGLTTKHVDPRAEQGVALRSGERRRARRDAGRLRCAADPVPTAQSASLGLTCPGLRTGCGTTGLRCCSWCRAAWSPATVPARRSPSRRAGPCGFRLDTRDCRSVGTDRFSGRPTVYGAALRSRRSIRIVAHRDRLTHGADDDPRRRFISLI